MSDVLAVKQAAVLHCIYGIGDTEQSVLINSAVRYSIMIGIHAISSLRSNSFIILPLPEKN